MRAVSLGIGVALVAGLVALDRGIVHAQDDKIRVHIAHVADADPDTPNQRGLLATAIAEAEIAAQHARLAAKTLDSLDQMKLHAGHVINAVDPTLEPKGPGLGYGVRKAAAAVAAHVDLAASADRAPDAVQKEAVYAAAWAQNVVQWGDETIDVAQRIRACGSPNEAAILVGELTTLTDKMLNGVPAIGREGLRGGLHQALERVEMMKKAAGL